MVVHARSLDLLDLLTPTDRSLGSEIRVQVQIQYVKVKVKAEAEVKSSASGFGSKRTRQATRQRDRQTFMHKVIVQNPSSLDRTIEDPFSSTVLHHCNSIVQCLYTYRFSDDLI